MSVSEDFLEHVRDLLAGFGPIRGKRMFGGVGFYADDLFFAIADDDTLYLKVDDETETAFVEAGADPFTYLAHGETKIMRYRRLPDSALDDPDEAVVWARLGLDAARRAAARKRPRKPRG